MFLTKRQLEVLKAQTMRGKYIMLPEDRLGVSIQCINSTNTKIFYNFVEALELMADVELGAVFDNRLRRNRDKIWMLTKAIRARVKDL